MILILNALDPVLPGMQGPRVCRPVPLPEPWPVHGGEVYCVGHQGQYTATVVTE